MIFHVVYEGGTTFFRFVTNHAFYFTDIRTDRRTDSFVVTRPRCMQCIQRVKNRRFTG